MCNVAPYCCIAEKPGAPPPPAEAPAAAPTKKLDNLFFIEEPKPAHVTESETRNIHIVHNTLHENLCIQFSHNSVRSYMLHCKVPRDDCCCVFGAISIN